MDKLENNTEYNTELLIKQMFPIHSSYTGGEPSENEKLISRIVKMTHNTLHKDLPSAIFNLIREERYKLSQERIICSAIHYIHGPVHENQPAGIDSGFIISGRRHKDCYAALKSIAYVVDQPRKAEFMKDKIKRENQGFITNRNRYVGRREAMLIAKAAGQLLRPDLHEGMEDRELTSEDLY
jgi:hypothetical protein